MRGRDPSGRVFRAFLYGLPKASNECKKDELFFCQGSREEVAELAFRETITSKGETTSRARNIGFKNWCASPDGFLVVMDHPDRPARRAA